MYPITESHLIYVANLVTDKPLNDILSLERAEEILSWCEDTALTLNMSDVTQDQINNLLRWVRESKEFIAKYADTHYETLMEATR